MNAHPPRQHTPRTAIPSPLCLITQKVQETLNKYNADLKNGAEILPILSKAEVDFKTTRSNNGGFSINVLVFKFGVNRQSDSTEEVTFSYLRPPKSPTFGLSKAPHDFSTSVLQLLEDSAAQVKAAHTFGGLPFSGLTLNLSFGVTWDMSAGVNVPVVALVTAGGNFNHKSASVQSVRLAYGP